MSDQTITTTGVRRERRTERRLMRHLLSLVAAAIVCMGGIGIAAPAQAGTPGCITHQEYRSIKQGMTRGKVRKIVGTDGLTSYVSAPQGPSKVRDMQRYYGECGTGAGYVLVGFSKHPNDLWHVSNKSASWA